MAILEVKELHKLYGEVRAVDGVSFAVAEGEVFGLLGPNGAGKTTTISMISCLIAPTSGDVVVGGHSVREAPGRVKRLLGVVPQDIALYPTLTAAENLRFWGRMYGLRGAQLRERVQEALELAGLEDRARDRIEKYSGGMKRRINIAAGILHHPRILLMDEPTVGIDPQSRNHILDTVKRLNAEGMTVIYTSHYMEEVEQLCDRVGIVDRGSLIALGTKDELRRLVGDADVVTIEAEGVTEELLGAMRAIPGVEAVSAADGCVEVLAKESGSVLGGVVAAMNAAGVALRGVQVREPNLESVFLHLTGKSLRD